MSTRSPSNKSKIRGQLSLFKVLPRSSASWKVIYAHDELCSAIRHRDNMAASTLIDWLDVRVLNTKRKDGKTPLMLASLYDLPRIAWILVTRRVDVLAKDDTGWSALDYRRGRPDFERWERMFKSKAND